MKQEALEQILKMAAEADKLLEQKKQSIRKAQKELGFEPGEALAYLEEKAKTSPHAQRHLEEHYARLHGKAKVSATESPNRANAAIRQTFQEECELEGEGQGFKIKNWARL